MDQRRIKSGRQSNGLGKHGGRSSVGDSVQGLAPPVVCGNLQSWNRARLVHQLGRFLLQSHPRDQIINPQIEGLCRIQIGRKGWRLSGLREPGAEQNERDQQSVNEKDSKTIAHGIDSLGGDFRGIQRREEYNIVNVHGKHDHGDPRVPRTSPRARFVSAPRVASPKGGRSR
jgi:hypothetical protein